MDTGLNPDPNTLDRAVNSTTMSYKLHLTNYRLKTNSQKLYEANSTSNNQLRTTRELLHRSVTNEYKYHRFMNHFITQLLNKTQITLTLLEHYQIITNKQFY